MSSRDAHFVDWKRIIMSVVQMVKHVTSKKIFRYSSFTSGRYPFSCALSACSNELIERFKSPSGRDVTSIKFKLAREIQRARDETKRRRTFFSHTLEEMRVCKQQNNAFTVRNAASCMDNGYALQESTVTHYFLSAE